jgi:hypothetical protein
MIVLNRWDSQLVWLAKGWVKTNIEDMDYKDALKNLWSKRAGVYPEDINLGFISPILIKLVEKTEPNFMLIKLIGDLAPVQYFETKYTNNKEYAERVCWVCLYQYLSVLQTNEHDENGDLYPLVEMMPFELDLFIDDREKDA